MLTDDKERALAKAADALIYEDSMHRPTGEHFARIAIEEYEKAMHALGWTWFKGLQPSPGDAP